MRKQKSASELGFTRYDSARLKKAIEKVEDKRTYLRLKSVQMVAEGYQISEVAKIWDISLRIIYSWIKIYLKDHQPRSLFDKPRQGRPRQAQKITDDRILKELGRNHIPLGYMVTTWTVATLAHYLSKRYKCPITRHTLYRRMKAMGLEYKQPKYFYEEKDPHRAQKKGL